MSGQTAVSYYCTCFSIAVSQGVNCGLLVYYHTIFSVGGRQSSQQTAVSYYYTVFSSVGGQSWGENATFPNIHKIFVYYS